MFGNCLCGKVSFEIDRKNINLYQCHCSLCRKQSGSYSNAATIIENERFRFLTGKELINSWVKESGFRSDFCSICGSPVPNPLRNTNFYWVPAGLLENNNPSNKVILHLCLNSRANWAPLALNTENYEELPPLSYLIERLNSEENL
jgi:hypothetical protein